jgi:hypothetical protein
MWPELRLCGVVVFADHARHDGFSPDGPQVGEVGCVPGRQCLKVWRSLAPGCGIGAGAGTILGVLLSLVYRLVRSLLGLLKMLVRSDVSKGVELLVLRHENQVLRRQLGGRPRWDHVDRLWLVALSRLVNRRRWSQIFPVTRPRSCAGIVIWFPASGPSPTGAGQDDRPPVRRSRR